MWQIDPENQPNFRGNRNDLHEFLKLANSRIRSEEREQALHGWEEYKTARQFAAYRAQGRAIKKGGHMRALISRVIDLTGANLDGITAGYADLRGVIFDDCSLCGAWLKGAKMENASLQRANFSASSDPDIRPFAGGLLYADLRKADFTDANLAGVDLSFAQLNGANFTNTNLTDASLEGASLIRTTIEGARLRQTRVYGISAWDLQGKAAEQTDLVITPGSDSPITVDNLKVAQFIYLLINNPEIRSVIDTLTSKVVLILGRFTNERKRVLDRVKAALRARDLLPIIFDFDTPRNRDVRETVVTLAHMARFIVADLTDPRSIPQELMAIVPALPSVPVKPLLLKGERPWGMFASIARFPWVLPIFEYNDPRHLVTQIEPGIIQPVEDYLRKTVKPTSE